MTAPNLPGLLLVGHKRSLHCIDTSCQGILSDNKGSSSEESGDKNRMLLTSHTCIHLPFLHCHTKSKLPSVVLRINVCEHKGQVLPCKAKLPKCINNTNGAGGRCSRVEGTRYIICDFCGAQAACWLCTMLLKLVTGNAPGTP